MKKTDLPDRTQRELDWNTLTTGEFELRDRINRAVAVGETPKNDLLRQWWAAVEKICVAYCRNVAEHSLSQRPDHEPFPAELASCIGGLAGYLAVGKLPEPIRDAARSGRTSPGPDERRDIRWAVAYRRACERDGIVHMGVTHRISDRHPVKTLAAWFGVERRTVRDWCKQYEPAYLGANTLTEEVLTAGVPAGGVGAEAAAFVGGRP